MQFFGCLVAWVVAMTVGVIWHGYTLSILWGWFIVTTFGARPLNIPEAIGVSCIISFMRAKADRHKDDRSLREKVLAGGLYIFIGPLISLGFGWIIKQWL